MKLRRSYGPEYVRDHDRDVELFTRLRNTTDPADRIRIRAELIEFHLSLAHRLARRFTGRGVSIEDLDQVAALALVKAVDRYDPGQGATFTTFATPTVLGELKRYFRDCTWPVHIPRGLKERSLTIAATRERLTHELGHSPTVAELAADLGCSDAEVLAAMTCAATYRPESLDRATGPDGESDVTGGLDPRLDAVDDHESLMRLLGDFSDRDRDLLRLRFVEELPQWQIAERMEVSQMQVSRLLGRCLGRLRQGLQPAS